MHVLSRSITWLINDGRFYWFKMHFHTYWGARYIYLYSAQALRFHHVLPVLHLIMQRKQSITKYFLYIRRYSLIRNSVSRDTPFLFLPWHEFLFATSFYKDLQFVRRDTHCHSEWPASLNIQACLRVWHDEERLVYILTAAMHILLEQYDGDKDS